MADELYCVDRSEGLNRTNKEPRGLCRFFLIPLCFLILLIIVCLVFIIGAPGPERTKKLETNQKHPEYITTFG